MTSHLCNTHSNILPHTLHTVMQHFAAQRERLPPDTPWATELSEEWLSNDREQPIVPWLTDSSLSLSQLWAIAQTQPVAHDLQFIVQQSSNILTHSFMCVFSKGSIWKQAYLRNHWDTICSAKQRGSKGLSFWPVIKSTKTIQQCTSWACVNKDWRKASVAYWSLQINRG